MQVIQMLNLNFENCAGNVDQSEITDGSGSSASHWSGTHSAATDRRRSSFAIPDCRYGGTLPNRSNRLIDRTTVSRDRHVWSRVCFSLVVCLFGRPMFATSFFFFGSDCVWLIQWCTMNTMNVNCSRLGPRKGNFFKSNVNPKWHSLHVSIALNRRIYVGRDGSVRAWRHVICYTWFFFFVFQKIQILCKASVIL